MLQLLETGRALYVLAGICVLGLLARMMTRNLYKRLVKESANLATAKNKSLKELKQRAENAYRMNQGLRDSSVWLEHQLGDLRFRGMTLAGWSNLCMRLTWLCLLLGGTGAFFSYWYRLDTYYIVMYGGGSVLMAMLTMLFDHGVSGAWRDQLVTALQDYMENVMCPRLARNQPENGGRLGGWSRQADRAERYDRGDHGDLPDPGGRGERAGIREVSAASGTESGKRNAAGGRRGRRETMPVSEPGMDPVDTIQDADYLKRSLEQIAASREKGRTTDENWLKNLGPEELQVIGDILKQYLA